MHCSEFTGSGEEMAANAKHGTIDNAGDSSD
jgi:hypothetical protein